VKEIANYDSETKVLWLSADNTNNKYESLFRRAKGNVLIKIKSQLDRNIIGFSCNIHIIYNCAKTAFDPMPVYIEELVTKIYGYIHI
jgi:hypothetical protein